jgi:hypothetical protein
MCSNDGDHGTINVTRWNHSKKSSVCPPPVVRERIRAYEACILQKSCQKTNLSLTPHLQCCNIYLVFTKTINSTILFKNSKYSSTWDTVTHYVILSTRLYFRISESNPDHLVYCAAVKRWQKINERFINKRNYFN